MIQMKLKIDDDFVFCMDRNNVMNSWSAFSPDYQLSPTLTKLPNPADIKTWNLKFCMLDMKDLKFLEDKLNGFEAMEEKEEFTKGFIRSQTDCMNHHPKHLYIRAIPSAKLGDSSRIFCDEALEIIPLILKQQEATNLQEDKLESYRIQWKSESENVYKTIEFEEFEKILEEFGCDKKLISVIEDPCTTVTRTETLQQGCHIRTFAHDYEIVMDISQSIRWLFTSVVEGVNWKTDKCKDHKHCLKHTKPEILKIMNEFLSYGMGSYLSLSYVMESIQNFRKECEYTYLRPQSSLDYLLTRRAPDDKIHYNHYNEVVKFFELQRFHNFLQKGKQTEMTVWMTKSFMKLGFILNFFTEIENALLKNLMIDVMVFEIPKDQRREAIDFWSPFRTPEPIPVPRVPTPIPDGFGIIPKLKNLELADALQTDQESHEQSTTQVLFQKEGFETEISELKEENERLKKEIEKYKNPFWK